MKFSSITAGNNLTPIVGTLLALQLLAGGFYYYGTDPGGDGGIGYVELRGWDGGSYSDPIQLTEGESGPFTYSFVFAEEATPAPGRDHRLRAQFGIRLLPNDYLWLDAIYLGEEAGGEVYGQQIPELPPGSYEYTFRFALEGNNYVLADGDGSLNGFDSALVGTIEVEATIPDRDMDGVPDFCESDDDAILATPGTLITNMNLPDSDDDGLLDGEELGVDCFITKGATQFATNPRKYDTDGDGFGDGLEVLVLFTDPLDPDSPLPDSPGLEDADNDGVPAIADTDDNNPDSDGDGYKDGYELERMTDPNDPFSKPPLGDSNGNGTITAADITLLKQFIQGLDPASGIPGNMDTTRNGRLSASDATRLKQYFADPTRLIP